MMIVAVSGYNESGKTTLSRHLTEALTESGVPFKSVRFDSLYPSKHLRKKKKKVCSANPDQKGTVGLRQIEGQRGDWNQPFRLRQFIDVCGAAVAIWWLRLVSRRQVVVCDRYFYDRFIHFRPQGFLYRLALCCMPRPDLSFVLLPDETTWEQRILARMQRKMGVVLEQLSDDDRRELALVYDRYELLLSKYPELQRVDTGKEEACDEAVQLLFASSGWSRAE